MNKDANAQAGCGLLVMMIGGALLITVLDVPISILIAILVIMFFVGMPFEAGRR